MKPHVLLIDRLYHVCGEELLREHADVTLLRKPPREAALAEAARAHGICARYPNRVDAALIAAALDLVVIATSGRGTDAVDLEAATRQGVAVVNNPGIGRIPVSEHALFLLLALTRHGPAHDAMTRAGRGWRDRLGPGNTIRDLEGGTLGIVGLGQIGREMARKCIAAFGMEVIAYDPYVDDETARAIGVALVPKLEELLEQSDHVSVHAELNDETHHMFDEAALRHMRPEACLINTARGKIDSQAALLRALREGWIRAAALDVYEDEPVGADNPLGALDNLILTPHVAGLTEGSMIRGALSVAEQLLQVLSGERPANLVNPEAWPRAKQRAARLLAGE